MITHENHGTLFLGFGAFFAAVLLVGGGVLTATNGGYWTLLFPAAYVAAPVTIGPAVRRSVARGSVNVPAAAAEPAVRARVLPRLLILPSAGVWLVSTSAFIKSDLFVTPVGMHLFIIAMGACLSLFIPLGLGMNDAADGRTGGHGSGA